MSNHVKRTPEFCARVDNLIHAVNMKLGPESELALELTDVLLNHTTDSGCVVKARPDEPIFTIRAKDPLSVYTINYWCQQAKERSLHEKLKIEDAAQAGLDMAQWRLENGLK